MAFPRIDSVATIDHHTNLNIRQSSLLRNHYTLYDTMTTTDKVKQTAKDEVNRVSGLAQEAAKSGAYIYPLKVCS